MRKLTPVDDLIIQLDNGLRTIIGKPRTTGRRSPIEELPEPELSAEERLLSARLMRINHAGEVAAQALYQGQALTARQSAVRDKMRQAAVEENDHLEWCETRIKELGEHLSYLNPLWYAGSLMIGAAAGAAGDKWSLGFVAETEHQVVKHIDEHLQRLPVNDDKSRAILQQMRIDEKKHATMALRSGGAPLPAPIKFLMAQTAKIMTRTAFWI